MLGSALLLRAQKEIYGERSGGSIARVKRMPRRMLVAMAATAAALALPGAALAQEPPPYTDLSKLPCKPYPAEENREQEICSGEVVSFDGATLDVDVTKPLDNARGQRHPMIVMLHGFGNDKDEWQYLNDEGDNADKWHWNSHWFAKHGYYVVNYTARGFDTDREPDEGTGKPDTPPGTSYSEPNGTIHLKSREFEVRDTQWLAALTAKAFEDIAEDQVAVTGGSYGGGESWLQASQASWTFPRDCSEAAKQPTPDDPPDPEKDPLAACKTGKTPKDGLDALQLQVAVPKYPWTDLAYSLTPNGHPGPVGNHYDSATQRPDKGTEACKQLLAPETPPRECNPLGVEKFSYNNGLYQLGNEPGAKFEEGETQTPSAERAEAGGQINVHCWKHRADGIARQQGSPPPATCEPPGDPTDTAGVEDPVIQQIRRGLTEYRGAYYQDWEAQKSGRKVAVFAIQGWTDDLFTAVEATRIFKLLKELDPLWPVEVELADVGHPRAQNKPKTWQRLNDQAWQFLQSNIQGSHEQQTTVSSEQSVCPGDPNKDAAQRLHATSPEGLAKGTLSVNYVKPGSINNPAGAGDVRGPFSDPIFGEPGCKESPPSEPFPLEFTKYREQSNPLKDPAHYIGLGTVTLPRLTSAALSASINARLWDVKPNGEERLIDRGTYRFDAPAYDEPGLEPREVKLPLFGNHFVVDRGHRLRLEVTLVDFPFFRPSNFVNQVSFGSPTLTLPTREASDRTISGDPST